MKNPKTPNTAEINTMARLKRENERLKKESDLQEKVATVSRGTTSERF